MSSASKASSKAGLRKKMANKRPRSASENCGYENGNNNTIEPKCRMYSQAINN